MIFMNMENSKANQSYKLVLNLLQSSNKHIALKKLK